MLKEIAKDAATVVAVLVCTVAAFAVLFSVGPEGSGRAAKRVFQHECCRYPEIESTKAAEPGTDPRASSIR